MRARDLLEIFIDFLFRSLNPNLQSASSNFVMLIISQEYYLAKYKFCWPIWVNKENLANRKFVVHVLYLYTYKISKLKHCHRNLNQFYCNFFNIMDHLLVLFDFRVGQSCDQVLQTAYSIRQIFANKYVL